MQGKKVTSSITIHLPPSKNKRSSSYMSNYYRFFKLIKFRDEFRYKQNIAIQRSDYLMMQDFQNRLDEIVGQSIKKITNKKFRFCLFFIKYKLNNIKNVEA